MQSTGAVPKVTSTQGLDKSMHDMPEQTARILVRDNLSALIALNKLPANVDLEIVIGALEKLDELSFRVSDKANLDFKNRLVGIPEELKSEPINLSKHLLLCVVALSSPSYTESSSNDELRLIMQAATSTMAHLYEASKYTSDIGFSISSSKEYEDFLFDQMVMEVLKPDSEELAVRRSIIEEAERDAERFIQRVGQEPTFGRDLGFLNPLLKASFKFKKRVPDTIQASYLFFGQEFDRVLAMHSREDRESKLRQLVADLINITGKFHIMYGKAKMDFVRMSKVDGDKLIEWVSKSLENFLLSRGGKKADLSQYRERIVLALNSITPNLHLYSYLRFDGMPQKIEQFVRNFDLTPGRVKKFLDGEAVSTLSQAFLGIASTSKDGALRLGYNANQLRIGHESNEDRVTFKSLLAPRELAKICRGYSSELGFKTPQAIVDEVTAKLSSYKTIDQLVNYLPEPLKSLIYSAFTEKGQTLPDVSNILPHLLAIYFYPGKTTIEQVWSKWANKSNVFSRKKREEILHILKVRYPDTPILHEDSTILAASFLALSLYSAHKSKSTAEQNIRNSFEQFLSGSENSFYQLVSIVFGHIDQSEQTRVAQASIQVVPEPEITKQPTRSWFGRKTAIPAVQQTATPIWSLLDFEKKVATSAMNLSLKGFAYRILSHTEEALEHITNLNTDLQKDLIRLLLVGSRGTEELEKLYRAISLETHPDMLQQKWAGHDAICNCLKAVFQGLKDLKEMLNEQGLYSETEAKEKVEDLRSSINKFEELKTDLSRNSITTDNRQIIEMLTRNNELLVQVLERLEKIESAVFARE